MIEMVKNFGDRVWRAIKKPELVFAIILLSVFSALSIGHEGLRLVFATAFKTSALSGAAS